MDFNSLMMQAQKLQEQMEKQEQEINNREYHSTVMSDVVEVTMLGNFEVQEIKIKQQYIEDNYEDKEDFINILQDSICVAVSELTRKIQEDKEGMIGGLAGGLNIPGLK